MSRLSGRLSVIDSFKTYAILTSEGKDRGFFIDLRDEKNIEAYPLGLDPPDNPTFTALAIPGDEFDRSNPNFVSENLNASLTQDLYYYYAYTYLSLDEDEDGEKAPWYGMESNPNEAPDTFESPLIYVGRHRTTGAVAAAAQVHMPYERIAPITHIRLYRTQGLTGNDFAGTGTPITDFKDGILPILYRVADIDITALPATGIVIFYDGLPDTTLADKEQLRRDNDRLPEEVRQIFYYNGRVFGAAGDRLVYSDLRFGNIVPWAFPKANEIRVENGVTFCAEIREVLLFGDENGLHRLTGGTEYDFRVGEIGAIGPIDGFSWGRTTNELAFVGTDGLYLTDGVQLLKISDKVLDGFFENQKVLSGAVGFQRDGDILFTLLLPYNKTMQLKFEDGYWVRWDLPIYQYAFIDNRIFYTKATGELQELHYKDADADTTAIEWRFESHILDLGGKMANQLKRFSMLQLTGDAENPVTVEVFKDLDIESDTPTTTDVLNARDSLQPVRIPINRIARRLKFRVSGKGAVILQGLKLEILK